jgi:hypothetical protein
MNEDLIKRLKQALLHPEAHSKECIADLVEELNRSTLLETDILSPPAWAMWNDMKDLGDFSHWQAYLISQYEPKAYHARVPLFPMFLDQPLSDEEIADITNIDPMWLENGFNHTISNMREFVKEIERGIWDKLRTNKAGLPSEHSNKGT